MSFVVCYLTPTRQLAQVYIVHGSFGRINYALGVWEADVGTSETTFASE